MAINYLKGVGQISTRISNLDPFFEKYVHQHEHTMYIIVEKELSHHYKVVYANTLATKYFEGVNVVKASHFFKQFWPYIEREIHLLQTSSRRMCKLHTYINGNQQIFDLTIQKSEGITNEDTYVLELSEIENLTVAHESFIDLQQKYETIVDQSMDTILDITRDGHILKVNPAIRSVFGYEVKKVVGYKINDFIRQEYQRLLEDLIARVFMGELPDIVEIEFLHNEQLYLPVHVKILPIYEKGKIVQTQFIIRDLSKYYEYNEKFLFLSYRDQLTGLLNKKALAKYFIENRLMFLQEKKKFSIIHIGLDRFRLMNDAIGYSGADEILKKISKRLQDCCPSDYKLYRNGGDEFIIVVTNYSKKETERVAQLVLGEFEKSLLFNGQDYFLSASIGISIYPDDAHSLEKLLRKSEQAMFYVKENGRSNYRFYSDEMKSFVSNEMLLESHLRRALELKELAVYYQPQINLETGHITSFEALLRWNNRKFGLVSPGHFIRIAEDSGLIHSIGEWVLEQVCRQLKRWQDEGLSHISIAVNISPKQFKMAGFAKMIEAKIDKYSIHPSSLEVEITESSLTNMKETLHTLKELKQIGVMISVDDFGTGYSSLSYLKQYPIDIIKIDQSFVKDIEVDKKNEAIAKTIIHLAHNLGMDVIAEGVERERQAQILLNANCRKAQGFLYSKALPIEEIEEKYLSK